MGRTSCDRLRDEHALFEVQRPRARARPRAGRASPSRSSCRARWLSVCSRSRISSPDLRSRSPVGSSQSSSVGSVTMARAMPTRCSWPPESWRGIVVHPLAEADDRQRHLRRACGGRPSTAWSAAAAAPRCAPRSAPAAGCRAGTRSRCAAPATPTACRPTACRCGRRRRVIDPSLGVSRPPSRLSSVVLPEPDGPISARKSPVGMSRLTPWRTSIRSPPRW